MNDDKIGEFWSIIQMNDDKIGEFWNNNDE